jgi:hypothetical protein
VKIALGIFVVLSATSVALSTTYRLGITDPILLGVVGTVVFFATLRLVDRS